MKTILSFIASAIIAHIVSVATHAYDDSGYLKYELLFIVCGTALIRILCFKDSYEG